MKLKYILLFLILALAAINTILYFAVVEMEEAVVSPPPIRMEEVAPPEMIVTGVCTFGDCPAGTTEKSSAVAEETTIPDAATEAVKESLTTPSQVTANFQLLTEPEQEDPETEAETVTEPKEEPEPEEAPERSGQTVSCFVTAYCGCWECSGKFGAYTRFGTPCRANHTVAVDPDFIPYWTQLEINGIVYTAEDCGSAVNGWEIDIYFPEHWQTEAWKTGWYDVTIY